MQYVVTFLQQLQESSTHLYILQTQQYIVTFITLYNLLSLKAVEGKRKAIIYL